MAVIPDQAGLGTDPQRALRILGQRRDHAVRNLVVIADRLEHALVEIEITRRARLCRGREGAAQSQQCEAHSAPRSPQTEFLPWLRRISSNRCLPATSPARRHRRTPSHCCPDRRPRRRPRFPEAHRRPRGCRRARRRHCNARSVRAARRSQPSDIGRRDSRTGADLLIERQRKIEVSVAIEVGRGDGHRDVRSGFLRQPLHVLPAHVIDAKPVAETAVVSRREHGQQGPRFALRHRRDRYSGDGCAGRQSDDIDTAKGTTVAQLDQPPSMRDRSAR